MLTIQDSIEISNIIDKIAPLVAKDILATYNTSDDKRKLNALQHAVYVGWCIGKGFDTRYEVEQQC